MLHLLSYFYGFITENFLLYIKTGIERLIKWFQNLYCSGKEDHDKSALFWETMPEDKDNPQLAAMEAIKAESTPEELADNHRVN